jgi:SAM-dependent methyltransferase
VNGILKTHAGTTWPKHVPRLTPEQIEIGDEWMKYFHETYPRKYGAIARFNHTYALRTASAGVRTLEIGAGIGGHLEYEDLAVQRYVALELRAEMAAEIERAHPQACTIVGDVQERIPVEDESFDRAIAIHVLEHLPDLPAALRELYRVLRPGGVVAVVIPCEGGLGYGLGRRLTTQRTFEKRYRIKYAPYIKTEHVNESAEIIRELRDVFAVEHREFFPTRVPSVHLNLCIGLTCRRA